MSRQKYDFMKLKERFVKTSNKELMREYVGILAELDYIQEHMSVDDYMEYVVPLRMAKDYIEEYLARLICYENGIETPGM